MRNRLFLLLVTLLALQGIACANEREEIAKLYQAALGGNREAVDPCIAKLEAAVKVDPSNQLARVYLGSSYTLRSRDLGFGPSKLQTLKQGLAEMDAAVLAAPRDPHVRLVRAMTTDALPFFAGRRQSTDDDFKWLGAAAKQTPGVLSEGDLAVIRAHNH